MIYIDLDMAISQVHDMDIVPVSCTVSCLVVVSIDWYFLSSTYGYLHKTSTLLGDIVGADSKVNGAYTVLGQKWNFQVAVLPSSSKKILILSEDNIGAQCWAPVALGHRTRGAKRPESSALRQNELVVHQLFAPREDHMSLGIPSLIINLSLDGH